jgi:adenylylsulfate kinase
VSGVVVWLTGLPRAGKSTLGRSVADALRSRGAQVSVLDGDEVRAALVPTPGYDALARDAFYETLGRLAAMLARQGQIVVVPATAHRRAYREAARALAPRFVEVHVATPIEVCRTRDPSRLYEEAGAALPGAGVAYEAPLAPEVTASASDDPEAHAQILRLILAD